MEKILYIALFGAAGCISRYFISGWMYDVFGAILPYGTLMVNVIGAFMIGFIMEFGLYSDVISPDMRSGLTIGLLGGLTTFSTFSYETFRFLEDGEFIIAFVNIFLNVALCILFVWIGIMVARYIL